MSEVRPLRAYAEVSLGRQRAPQHDEGPHMVPYLRAANVKDGTLDLTDVKEMNFTPSEQAIFDLRPGDVLVTEGSGSIRAVGASAIWTGEMAGKVCFQNTLLRLRPRRDTDPRFLAWWCRYAFGDGLFASIATGANIYHISAERVRAVPVRYMPPARQKMIADFLDVETALIRQLLEKRRQMRNLLREKFAAERDDLLDRLPFSRAPLARFVTSLTQGASPQAGSRPAGPSERGLLKLNAVKDGAFVPAENKVLDVDIAENALSIRAGDLLVTRANTPSYVGEVCAVRNDYPHLILCDLIYRLRVSEDLDPEFASLVLQSRRGRSTLSSLARGTSQSMVKLRGKTSDLCACRFRLWKSSDR